MNEAFYPDSQAIRRELESRVSKDAWTEVSEAEFQAMITITKGRSRKAIEAALCEFAELITRTHMAKQLPTTGKAK